MQLVKGFQCHILPTIQPEYTDMLCEDNCGVVNIAHTHKKNLLKYYYIIISKMSAYYKRKELKQKLDHEVQAAKE